MTTSTRAAAVPRSQTPDQQIAPSPSATGRGTKYYWATSVFGTYPEALRTGLAQGLNETVSSDVTSANDLLATIARLNADIARAEVSGTIRANDLRDLRQQRLEELAGLVTITTATNASGSVNVTIGGIAMVTEGNQVESLEAYDNGSGNLFVRALGAGTTVTLTSGRLQGSIDARDESIDNLQSGINSLASLLISEVNGLHSSGYGLNGTTGRDLFAGASAGDIAVQTDLINDPALVQAADAPGEPGSNTVMLQLTALRDQSHAALNDQTFQQNYNLTVTSLGQDLVEANDRLGDQEAIMTMLSNHRASVSGVSLDEEMADLVRYQQAFAASARIIRTVDEMLSTLMAI